MNELGIDPEITWRCVLQRAAARSLLVGITFIIALSVPNFGSILSLVAAVKTILATLILPALFYLLLHSKSLRRGSWVSFICTELGRALSFLT